MKINCLSLSLLLLGAILKILLTPLMTTIVQIEASLDASLEKIPATLLNFICWQHDEKSHNGASEPYVTPKDNIL